MSEKIDFTKVADMCLVITDLTKIIALMFPKDEEYLLKNLASAAIHISMFSRDLVNHISKRELLTPCTDENKFLQKCGCKDENN